MRNPEQSYESDRPQNRDVVKGALAGMAGGLVASWIMNRVEHVMESAEPEILHPRAQGFAPPIAEEQLASTTYSSSAPQAFMNGEAPKPKPTVRMANRISKTFLRHELAEERKDVAGRAVHYAFGTLVGGLYGAMAEMSPEVVSRLGGVPFGMAVWLLADEIALPAFRLAGKPQEVPVKKHATALAEHFVYGATTDGVRRLLRKTAIH
jgi:putative membrane protein